MRHESSAIGEEQTVSIESVVTVTVPKLAAFLTSRELSGQYLDSVLDGRPAALLRETVSTAIRRNIGAFMTPRVLADQVVESLMMSENSFDAVVDPACGLGDLLLSVADQLPLGSTFDQTLQHWNSLLVGRDVQPFFVTVTRLRLALKAAARHGMSLLPRDSEQAFTQIDVGNSLSDFPFRAGTVALILNPPFCSTPSTDDLTWTSGDVSAAAVFVYKALSAVADGTKLALILPDVLRSGSRYEAWRKQIATKLSDSRVILSGQFDPATDVDVFLLTGTKRTGDPQSITWYSSSDGKTVLDDFTVSVGPVVPHRHKDEGIRHPFLTARDFNSGDIIRADSLATRGFSGTTFEPPFIVLPRTNRPHPNRRLKAAIVEGNLATAVENHVIVLRPRSHKTITRETLAWFEGREVTNWLNSRMCCRHLTVAAVASIPLP